MREDEARKLDQGLDLHFAIARDRRTQHRLELQTAHAAPTNAGAREIQQGTIGFGPSPTSKLDKTAIERTFSPEFRNRLDAWLTFQGLGPEVIQKIVDKFVAELAEQLKEKKVRLELTDEARRWLGEKGYDKLFGARPMARLIKNELKRPLADAVLFGDLTHGGTVTVDVKDGKLSLQIQGSEKPSATTKDKD